MNEYIFHLLFIFYSILIYKYRNNLAKYFGLIDFPDNIRKSHSEPVPCVGGTIIFPYIIFSLVLIQFQLIISFKILLLWIFLLSSFFLIGLIDDKINLNAKTKTFILIFILFIILPLDGSLLVKNVIFKDINLAITLNEGSIFFTIFCIYFFYNSLNFSDGYNGISISIALYFLLVIFYLNNEFNLLQQSCIISLFIILIPNLLGKIFIGNSGVSFLSILISILVIDLYNNKYIYFDEIILIFFLPTIDSARITIERIIKGRSPFESDKNHFHHLLANIIDKKYVFIFYLIFTMLPYMTLKTNINSYFNLVIFIFLYFFILFFLKKKNV